MPFWRSYLRRDFGVKVLHVYVSVPFIVGDSLDARAYDWHFTLGFKDCVRVIFVMKNCHERAFRHHAFLFAYLPMFSKEMCTLGA